MAKMSLKKYLNEAKMSLNDLNEVKMSLKLFK